MGHNSIGRSSVVDGGLPGYFPRLNQPPPGDQGGWVTKSQTTEGIPEAARSHEVLISILKPWFLWRPQQIVLRAMSSIRRDPPGLRELRVTWGAKLLADPGKHL